MDKLQVLADSCSACRECPHGYSAKQSIFGKGNPHSTLVFVGEAPGETDNEQGELFVGESGKLLDKMIARMALEARKLRFELPNPYFCNVVKHHPSGGKLLKSGEDVRACAPKLFEQLNTLPNARVIVALGRVAAQTLLGCDHTIGDLRGCSFHNSRTGDKLVWTDDSGTLEEDDFAYADLPNSSSEWRDPSLPRLTVVPTWHPAYLNHQPNRMEPRHQCWSDLQLVLRKLHELDDEIPF